MNLEESHFCTEMAEVDGARAQVEWPEGDAWDRGQPVDSGNTLLPWTTSAARAGAQAAVSRRKALKRTGGREDPALGPPSNLANRVAMRKTQEAAEDTEECVWPYHLRQEDAFPVSDSESQKAFLVTKRVEHPPNKQLRGIQRRGRAAREAQDTTAAGELPPNLQLHQNQQHKVATDLGSASEHIRVQAAGIGPRSGASKAPVRPRTTDANTAPAGDNPVNASESLGERNGKEEDKPHSLQHSGPYMLLTREPAPSKTWLQDAQDRNHRAREAEQEARIESASLRSPGSPQRGPGIRGERQMDEVTSSAINVPVSVSVQPVVLERYKEKETELQREKARGAMLQGHGLAFETTVTPVRQESRLRAMLKEAKGRKAQQMSAASSISNQDPLSLQQTSSSPAASTSFGGEKEEDKAKDTLPVVEESSNETCASNAPMTPVAAVVVSPSKKKQHQLRAHLNAHSHRTEPFASVRFETQRQERREEFIKHATYKIVTAVSKSSVFTTQNPTRIEARGMLSRQALKISVEECSVDKLSKSQVRKNLIDLRDENDKQISTWRQHVHNEKMRPGETKISPVRGEDNISQWDLEKSVFLITQKAAIEDRRQSVSGGNQIQNIAEHSEAAEIGNTNDIYANAQGRKEDILVHAKSGREASMVVAKLPLPDIARCPKGLSLLNMYYLPF
jgi:hypothetical protein